MVTPSSTFNLILANVATAALAVILEWPLAVLLWPYLLQSIVIGWFSRKRMLALRRFSTENFTMNDQPVPETPESLRQVALFFAVHYGGFHVAYVVFLQASTPILEASDAVALAVLTASFVATHRASFEQNLAADRQGRPNLGTLMFLPYARIVPMHLTIILGASYATDGPLMLLLFAALKTGADVLMHYVEHVALQRQRKVASATSPADASTDGTHPPIARAHPLGSAIRRR